jgi:hypothetical protein
MRLWQVPEIWTGFKITTQKKQAPFLESAFLFISIL